MSEQMQDGKQPHLMAYNGTELENRQDADSPSLMSPDGDVRYESQEQSIQFPAGDYISPGLKRVKPDLCFPNMALGDPISSNWPYLRREIPHNWYVDQRYAQTGFLNRDEAHILYNTALKFQGQRALEIGCWLGWSACHLALAGVTLDIIDPVLEQSEFYQSIISSFKQAGVLDRANLISGYSPEQVHELASREQCKWPLIFIDGNHDAPGPLEDAQVCEQFAAEDALILFHDLASPDVAQGLAHLKQQGWQTRIYQTMQIMGVAWRGNVEPINHQPDPMILWQVPTHLRDFSVTPSPDADPRLSRYQEELDRLRTMVQAGQTELHHFWSVIAQLNEELQKTRDALEQSQALSEERHQWIEQLQAGKDWLENQMTAAQALSEERHRWIEQLQAGKDWLENQLTAAQVALERSQALSKEYQAENLRQKAVNIQQAERIQRLKSKRQKLQSRIEQKDFELRETHEKIEAMTGSKFWKLRESWFKLKQSLKR